MDNNKKAIKTEAPLQGVKCIAENCIFHDNSIECKASEIHIDPSNALTSKQTACATFKPKDRDID